MRFRFGSVTDVRTEKEAGRHDLISGAFESEEETTRFIRFVLRWKKRK